MSRETAEPTIVCVTVRDALDEIHIECRFSDGQKRAAVKVDADFPKLADAIAEFLNVWNHVTAARCPPLCVDGGTHEFTGMHQIDTGMESAVCRCGLSAYDWTLMVSE